ncbi:hypothetical protein COU54_03470 [Candidatus Pacearchaeota archaeon CG10_big_fil_rev_8_21_14_0_10_31_24]|nr:MAG: hypothetical protein COU54_03470 [Candidatus Pacearchaeota archaeon CG10_big_fil_rev_8_21_14_0_10_31_24]
MDNNENMVDAIDEGAVVRVSESYAKREGLPILRSFSDSGYIESKESKTSRKIEEVKLAPFETLRKPLRSNQVTNSLVGNFQWIVSKKRRDLGMTRRQLAQNVGVSEQEVKLIENGVLSSDDFIVVSKIEKSLGLNLRKEGISNAPPIATLRSVASKSKVSSNYKDKLEKRKLERDFRRNVEKSNLQTEVQKESDELDTLDVFESKDLLSDELDLFEK